MAKKNKLPDIKGAQVLVPTNVSEIIGTRDDCFGKEYDLSTSECKRCGDSELCAVCFAQFMKKKKILSRIWKVWLILNLLLNICED